jgi:hypothetical protein
MAEIVVGARGFPASSLANFRPARATFIRTIEAEATREIDIAYQ